MLQFAPRAPGIAPNEDLVKERQSPAAAALKAARLVEIAGEYVGVVEQGGDNCGPEVEMFQTAVKGLTGPRAWCLSFVQFCAKRVDEELLGDATVLWPTEHCMTLWARTPVEARIDAPEPGALIVWEHVVDGVPTTKGHVGIITAVIDDDTIETIEGNTTAGATVEREGDGVYRKRRKVRSAPNEPLQVRGFLRAWIRGERA